MTKRVLFALLFAVAAGRGAAIAADDVTFEPGTGKYILVLLDGNTDVADAKTGKKPHEPDVAKLGGKLLYKHGYARVIKLPVAAAKRLLQQENVAYLQRVWLGEAASEFEIPTEMSGDVTAGAQDTEMHLETDRTWASGQYVYDGSGNIKSIGSDTYQYDATGRLTRAVMGDITQTYQYDAFGNLVEMTTGSARRAIGVDATSNRLTGETYDAAGNVTTRRGQPAYRYDSLAMVESVQTGPASIRRMLYGPDEERIAVVYEENMKRWMVRDFGGRVLREFYDDCCTWSWTEDYVYGEGRLLAGERQEVEMQGGEPTGVVRLRQFHTDHLGTVRLITNDKKEHVSNHDFLPFGIERTDPEYERKNSPMASDLRMRTEPMKYTSHEREFLGWYNWENTEYLDYMHARYYDPNVGRFLSPDPERNDRLGMPQAWNRYSYALNNPILRIDPDGRKDTIFIVNTTHGGGFTAAQLARLNRTVAGTRFEGNVRVIGPMASNAAMLRTISGADRTDMVGLIFHSGRSAFHGDGNIFTQAKLDASQKTGVLQGGLTGSDLAAAVNKSNPVGACMLAGCSSDQAAVSMMAGANVLTFGTTNHTRLDQLGNALVSTLGAMAQGASPGAAAAAGSQELTIKPDCRASFDCDPSQPAKVEAVVPPQ